MRHLIGCAVAGALCWGAAFAQAPAPSQDTRWTRVAASTVPAEPWEVYRISDTENVFVFRWSGYQSMFVVTPEGVLARDPMSQPQPGRLNLNIAKRYVEEIKRITSAPIKYLVYSHHHFDHAVGGKAFKAEGATVISHRRARQYHEQLGHAEVVPADEVVGDEGRTIVVGGTIVQLVYVGRNHSDNMLVVYLPKERIIHTVDFIGLDWRPTYHSGMADHHLFEWITSMQRVLQMDWDILITGHRYSNRLGKQE